MIKAEIGFAKGESRTPVKCGQEFHDKFDFAQR